MFLSFYLHIKSCKNFEKMTGPYHFKNYHFPKGFFYIHTREISIREFDVGDRNQSSFKLDARIISNRLVSKQELRKAFPVAHGRRKVERWKRPSSRKVFFHDCTLRHAKTLYFHLSAIFKDGYYHKIKNEWRAIRWEPIIETISLN